MRACSSSRPDAQPSTSSTCTPIISTIDLQCLLPCRSILPNLTAAVVLSTFYENWKLYQDELKKAIAPLTDEQLALRSAPELRTISHIAAHIIGARIGWFMHFLGEDVGDLAPLNDWDMQDAPPRTATELLDGLDASWQMMAGALSRWSPTDMQQVISRERNGQAHQFSRSWVIWHLIEHDLNHGGELSLTLGIHGLQAPDM